MYGLAKYEFFYEKLIEPAKQQGKRVAYVCRLRNTYKIFHVVDIWKGGRPIDRRLLRSDKTFGKLLSETKENGYSLLYQGMFAIPRDVWERYKKEYVKCEETWEKAKRGETYVDPKTGEEKRWKGLRLQLFKLGRLRRLVPWVLIDLDRKHGVEEVHVRKFVKYLHKLGIYPEVWRSAGGGWHVYVHLTGQVRWVQGIDGRKERREFLPYSSDYRLKLIVKALKSILQQLSIKYDSVSVDRAVWLEGVENPLKEGRKSTKIWNGAVHRLDKLFEKLRPVWEKEIREEAWRKFEREVLRASRRKRVVGVATTIEPEGGNESNPADFIVTNLKNGVVTRMLNAGHTIAEVGDVLRSHYRDPRAFDRAWKGAEAYIERTFRPLPKKEKKKEKQEGAEIKPRKHRHYWEYIPILNKVLREDPNLSIREIAKRTNIPKSSIADIFCIVSREQILSSPEEAQELMKSYAKGGDRLTEEQKEELREQGRERWLRYLEETLKKSLSTKGKKDIEVKDEGLKLVRETSVRIGLHSITSLPPKEGKRRGEDGEVGIKEEGAGSLSSSSPSPPSAPAGSSAPPAPSSRPHRVVDEVEEILRKVEEDWRKRGWRDEDIKEKREKLRKSLLRFLFGVLRGAKRESDLNLRRWRKQWDRVVTEELRTLLSRLGVEVKDGVPNTDPGGDTEAGIETETGSETDTGTEDLGRTTDTEAEEPTEEEEEEKEITEEELIDRLSMTRLSIPEIVDVVRRYRSGEFPEKEVERIIEENTPDHLKFEEEDEAIAWLEGQNGRYSIGDRVKVLVRAPNGAVVPYEFEKVRRKLYSGFEPSGEVKT